MNLSRPWRLAIYAPNMSTRNTIPIQNALKLPDTNPERMPSDGPPSRAELTTSRQCRDFVLVNILVNSGIRAAPSVPQLIMHESTIHRLPGSECSCHQLMTKVM